MTDTAPTTASEAAALLNARTADPAWSGKLMAGDLAIRKEFNDLSTLVASADTAEEALAGKHSQSFVWTGENGQLAPQQLARGIEVLRGEMGLSDAVIAQVLAGEDAPVTRAEHDAAKRLLAQRQNDQGWTEKLFKNDADVRREFALISVILNSTVRGAAA